MSTLWVTFWYLRLQCVSIHFLQALQFCVNRAEFVVNGIFFLPSVCYLWHKQAAPQAAMHTFQARCSDANHVLESCIHL